MQKFRPPLSDSEIAELERLAGLDFTTFNEGDVREIYIRPVLGLLGYQKDRDYSVSTEESFKLGEPFLRIGRDRIKLDYLNTIRKRNFWLIEAKDGSAGRNGTIADDDLCQAYFYALHHLVNCRYFAVCNGWLFNLYDRDQLDASLTPLLTVKSTELPSRFLEIDAVIGATQVQSHVKRKLIGEVEQVLSAEVTLERLEEFVKAVESASNRVRPTVLENFRVNYRREATAQQQSFAQILEQMRADQIVDTFFMSSITMGDISKVSEALVEKVIATSHSNHFLLFDKLLLTRLRPVKYFFYINAVHFLLRLVDRGVEHVDYHENGKPVPVRDLLHRYLWWTLTRFEDRQDIRVMTSFEGVYARTLKRVLIMARLPRTSIEGSVELDKFFLPEEKVAASALCPAGTLIQIVGAATMRACGGMLAKFYDSTKRSFKAALAEQELQNLKTASDQFLKVTESDYVRIRQELGSGWSELLFLDGLFADWDPVLVATLEMLTPRDETVRQLPPNIKKQIAYVLSLGIAGGIGATFEKKYSLKVPQLAEVRDRRSEFFSLRYKSDLDAIEEF
jgi:hypothetical protein